jgi:hypothetical protein
MSFEYTAPSVDGACTEKKTLFFSAVKVLQTTEKKMFFHCNVLGVIEVESTPEEIEDTESSFRDYLFKKGVNFYTGVNILVVLDGLVHIRTSKLNLVLEYDDKTKWVIIESKTEHDRDVLYEGIVKTRKQYDM